MTASDAFVISSSLGMASLRSIFDTISARRRHRAALSRVLDVCGRPHERHGQVVDLELRGKHDVFEILADQRLADNPPPRRLMPL
jgi:hypothetical protein